MITGGPLSPALSVIPAWLLNQFAFQTGWWTVVLTAAWGWPLIGIGMVAALITIHLTRMRPFKSEALLVIFVAGVGFIVDSLLQVNDWVRFANDPGGGFAPLWMVALWANFATTLNVSLSPLQRHPWLAALLGAGGGPAAYWAGAQLGAMTVSNAPAAFVTLALAWALLTPLLLSLAAALARRPQP